MYLIILSIASKVTNIYSPNHYPLLIVWRIFTASLAHSDLMQFLFSMLSYVPTAMRQEKSVGTVKFAFTFLIISTVIQVTFVLLALVLSLILRPTVMMMPSSGLWPVIMCDIVIECNKSPDVARW